jgi:hypothetical protein
VKRLKTFAHRNALQHPIFVLEEDEEFWDALHRWFLAASILGLS